MDRGQTLKSRILSIAETALPVLVLCAFAYLTIGREFPLLWALPFMLLAAAYVILYPRHILYIYYATLPFSIEYAFSSSLATNLPTEPLMLLLTVLVFFYVLFKAKDIPRWKLTHPISLMLVLHLAWILLTALISSEQVIGFKYFAAKLWFIASLYAVPLLWLERDELWKIMKLLIWITVPLAVFILGKHSLSGFGFLEANFVMKPFFRNHVVYAVFLLMLIPFSFYIARDESGPRRWLWYGVTLILVLGLYFNYTRAAHIGLVLLPMSYFIVKYRLTAYVLGGATLAMTALIIYLSVDNKYLEYAPDYESTVAHKSFESIMEATLKGKDISSMERVYRWVAAGYMVGEKPVTGFGPGSFYESYRPYTVLSFRTYVSDNKERSGIHNNYLMILVEQGIIGLLIFIFLLFYALIKAEQLYHRKVEKRDKFLALSAFMTLVSLAFVLLLNDLIETDKIGTFFFLALAILVLLDRPRQKSIQ